MPKVNSILASNTKYFKYKEEGTDNWFAGKTDGRLLPAGAVPISMYKYFEMCYGKEALRKATRELNKINGVTGKGTIEIATEQSVEHLPDANNPDFKHIIN